MRRTVSVALIVQPMAFACLVTGASARRATPAQATITQIGWLAGEWASEGGAVHFEERWTPPAGGAMLAVARTVRGDHMVAFEYLRIVERDGGLVYVAQPGGRPPTDFTLTAITANSATFENPAHDFPKLIRYTLRDDGTLEALVSDGGERGERLVFRRRPVERSPPITDIGGEGSGPR